MRLAPALAILAFTLGCGRTEPLSPRSSLVGDGGSGACRPSFEPPSADFGVVALGASETRTLSLVNHGTGTCRVEPALPPGTDPQFSLPSTAPFEIVAGRSGVVAATFSAHSGALPRSRSATLLAASDDGTQAQAALTASIAVGCDLRSSPFPLDFGNVLLNTDALASLTLENQGTSPCDVSGIALSASTDRLFSLGDRSSLSLAPEASATIPVAFSGADSTEPHQRTGSLLFTVSQPSGVPLNPPVAVEVPLKAFINTECQAGSQWIYTVDANRMLSLFNPLALSFTDIGTLDCPDFSGTFSMAVDQKAVAWVEFMSGALYRVDTANASCSPTSFQVDPTLTHFGMGFVYQPALGIDTLFVAGGDSFPATTSTLGTISFPSLSLHHLAPLDFGAPELTGTGDGELWGLAPASSSTTGVTTLARLDPETGARLTTLRYPTIGNNPDSWALKFWGGSFWLFLGDSIYEVPRRTGLLKVAVEHTGRSIVGAGVSTCAPLN